MITSIRNPRVQQIRNLLEQRKERDETRSFVIEGVRLVEEALVCGWLPRLVFFSDELSSRGQALIGEFTARHVEVEQVSSSVMQHMTGTETPQGILAVMPQRDLPVPEILDFMIIADQLRDPGNLGTLLRTAAAAGVQAIVLTPGTADAFSPKVLRAGMGAHFRLPVLQKTWQEIDNLIEARYPQLKIFVAEPAGGVSCWQIDLKQPLALVIGGEAEGIGIEARQRADELICIPMPGRIESLNAAVAAGILIFEVVRQRTS